MNLTVEDLLNIPELNLLKLVSGEKGIDGKISALDIMDNPDTYKWLKNGEFLITSGYILNQNPLLLNQLVKTISELGCSGIGIKVQRYFNNIPDEIIEASNLYGLPVIEIPYDYSLSYISSIFYKELYIVRRNFLDKSLEIHEHFTNTILMGGGLDKISQELSAIIQNPLIIIDKSGLLLSYSEFKNNPEPLKNFLSLEKGIEVFSIELFSQIKKSCDESLVSQKIIFNTNSKNIVLRVKPIVFTGEINGYIIVWESSKKLSKIDYVTIDQASIIISMDRLKQASIDAATQIARKDFFDDLLEGRITDLKSLQSLSQMHGLDVRQKHVCMVISISNLNVIVQNNNLNRIHLLDKVNKTIYNTRPSKERNVILINRNNYLIAFIQVKPKDMMNLENTLKELGHEFLDSINSELPDLEINIGIGNLYEDIIDLKMSFDDAFETLKLLNFSKFEKVAHFNDFKVLHLLGSIKSEKALITFFNSTLGKLQCYDKENKSELVETLIAFMDNNGNISQAAKEIFIHRNTFVYRISKIKEILDTDLKDSNKLLELNLGIKIKKLLNI